MNAVVDAGVDQPLLTRRNGAVALITLNRPEAANTIDAPMAAAFRKTVAELHADESVRALLISGAGKMFCAGGDLQRFAAEAEGAADYVAGLVNDFHAALKVLEDFRAPVITAVHGAAAGAGLGLALTADIVIASQSSRFVVAYTRAGLTPDGGSSWILPHLIGLRRALELTLLNRTINADEALALGMITEVVPDADVAARAQAIAEELAQGPTAAYVTARRLLRSAHANDYAGHLHAEALAIEGSFRTLDGLEGVRAFSERRTPIFRGA